MPNKNKTLPQALLRQCGSKTPQRGVWQVLPVENLDHLAAIGGVMNTGIVRTRMFYRRVMALLDAAAAAGANS